ncbi:Glutamyl aminopeptidase [Eumeta japonica]|uniref:Glutamyl aminopeptidase n=1 Tax=Eumeta variegata TaxID=151549 RepID=A0A4C2A883_EUMVA|nr:Glutamyl aminopeptidase [Eumeta japonica]
MEKPSAEISERLSKSVIPQNYKIILNPDLEAGTFSGNVNIRVDIKDERDHIRLHTKFLQIQNVKEISAVHNEINNVDEVTFATSVPMSTYLACFVICDFHYLEKNINSNGIGNDFKLRTFAQRDQLHKIKFALDIAQRATEFYITYYQIPFPLPKLVTFNLKESDIWIKINNNQVGYYRVNYPHEMWLDLIMQLQLKSDKFSLLPPTNDYEFLTCNVRKLFLDWLNNYESDGADVVEPDLRDLVYYYGMKSGTIEEWEHLWQIYLKEEDVQERAKLRHALERRTMLVYRSMYLTLAWEEKYIRSQDYLIVLDYLAQSPIGAALVWDDVRTRWPQYIERFSLNSRYLGNMIPAITADFNSENRLQEMETFFVKYPEAGAGRQLVVVH